MSVYMCLKSGIKCLKKTIYSLKFLNESSAVKGEWERDMMDLTLIENLQFNVGEFLYVLVQYRLARQHTIFVAFERVLVQIQYYTKIHSIICPFGIDSSIWCNMHVQMLCLLTVAQSECQYTHICYIVYGIWFEWCILICHKQMLAQWTHIQNFNLFPYIK